jgi:hypothetical protein
VGTGLDTDFRVGTGLDTGFKVATGFDTGFKVATGFGTGFKVATGFDTGLNYRLKPHTGLIYIHTYIHTDYIHIQLSLSLWHSLPSGTLFLSFSFLPSFMLLRTPSPQSVDYGFADVP